MSNFPRPGRVEWIGVRPAKRGALECPDAVQAIAGRGLAGDHYAASQRSGSGRKRQVTLLQAEHLAVVAALVNEPTMEPARLRRNLVVSGLNLLALKGLHFRIGDAVLEMTGLAHPCSRMEAELGDGGYNALRGHGGITAAVVGSGRISIGDAVVPLAPDSAGSLQRT